MSGCDAADAPLGVEASVRALEELSAGGTAQRAALSRKLEQLVYEAKSLRTVRRGGCSESTCSQRVGTAVERKVGREAVKQRLSSLETKRYSLSPEEEIRIRSMGDHFGCVDFTQPMDRLTRELALLCIIAATSGMLAWALDRPLTAAAFATAATFMAICLVSIVGQSK
jgi:hypothetical protein